jgi:hypothetical protein
MQVLVPLGQARDRSQGRLLRLIPRGFETTLSGQEDDEAEHICKRGDLRGCLSAANDLAPIVPIFDGERLRSVMRLALTPTMMTHPTFHPTLGAPVPDQMPHSSAMPERGISTPV